MHKVESMALSSGSKISKPYISKTFYPIVDKKFICVSRKAECNAKEYDFIDDVIFHIKPYLDKEKIAIYEIGGSEKTKRIFYTQDFCHLNRSQSSYVLSKSLLYFGNYNLYTNIASYLQKPYICPMNTEYTEAFDPYWSDDGKSEIVTPESNLKPSFSAQEYPKTINEINPEDIAVKILDTLDIKHSLGKIKTIFFGEEYTQNIVDIVPGQYAIEQMRLSGPVNIRMDKVFDLSFLSQCASLEHINIVTDKAIPENVLRLFGENLKLISFFVDKKTEIKDINTIQSKGTPLNLLSTDQKNITEIRLKFIDFQVRLFGHKSKKDLKTNTYSDLKFLSKRNIIANGEVYNSYLSLALGKNTSTVKNQKEFWEDLPFCRVFRENP